MEFFKKETRIDFMGMRNLTGIFSIVITIIALFFIFYRGLNFGLDFTGGTQLEVRFVKVLDPIQIKDALNKINIHHARIQQHGSSFDFLVRIQNHKEDDLKIQDKVKNALRHLDNEFELRRIETVGSEVGKELAEKGGLAVLVAVVATMAYIALRFEYRLAVSAAVGLLHDAILILGVFAGFQIEFDLTTLAAILAILGYSLNDTIVVFDRVRENFRKIRNSTSTEIMNQSINQTLSRTIMTSLLTFLVACALLIYGGESLFSFSLALCLGIIVGTYSSIFVSGTLALSLGLSKADLMPKPKLNVEY